MKIPKLNTPGKVLIIILASFLMALNIKTFVQTGGLYPGGATGLSLLVQTVFSRFLNLHIPYTIINLIFNSIPLYLGFRYIGKRFSLLTCVMIVLSSVFTDLIPSYHFTYDILLISIFGGLINGIVISMCLLSGGTSGGTDIISIFLSERKGFDAFNLILGFNVIILVAAGLLFGWDKALYSIIFQFASTEVIHMLFLRYQKETLFIVTTKPKEVCDVIYSATHHGATILEGEGSHEHCERNVVYSVVSREDRRRIMQVIRSVDETAFINSIKTETLAGRFYQPPTE